MEKLNSVDTLTIENLVDSAVDYLRQWSRTEFDNMLNSSTKTNKLPIIAPIGNKGYLVGNYGILPIGDNWWSVNYRYNDEEKYIFANKVAAVCYAVCQQTGKYIVADRLLKQDQDLGRFLTKNEFFKTRYHQACRRKNREKAELFRVRYQESAIKLSQARNVLEKSLKSTKYF